MFFFFFFRCATRHSRHLNASSSFSPFRQEPRFVQVTKTPFAKSTVFATARKRVSSSLSESAKKIGNGPNTVSESTVSNTELSEFFGAH